MYIKTCTKTCTYMYLVRFVLRSINKRTKTELRPDWIGLSDRAYRDKNSIHAFMNLNANEYIKLHQINCKSYANRSICLFRNKT